ncbi:TonB-dependent siderophore receptor [Nostoc sp.]|uniref:TonB-dependent siderophore receptor n=1 Tax=Nostoc sp. TaxID=1180 RepID=UPI002FF4B6A9
MGEIVQVTGVKANPTDKGVEVILQTLKGEQLQITNRSAGNNFIADIPNAQLRLPNGDGFTFRSEKPLAGITEITVTNFDANTIRVTVIGEASLPTVELFDSDEGLIFGLTSATSSAQQPPQKPEEEQPANQTQPTQPSASGDEPIELVVTGEQDGYRATDGSTATKTDTPLRDVPQSIQVVPRQVLEDQQVRNLGEALKNVPGVAQNQSSSRALFESPLIRGFDAGSDILRNGLRDPSNSNTSFDAAGIERIEVLKGPASVLYGQGSLGGVINYVTKQPLSEPYYSLEASAGNYNFYRGAIDLSGPLNSNKTVLYRLNLAAQTTESFVDFFHQQRYFVAPTLSWQLGDRTKLTFAAEYINQPKSAGQQGIPAVGSVLPNPNGRIPRNRSVGEPDDKDDSYAIRVGYNLEHRFSENWQIRNSFSFSQNQAFRDLIASTALAADNRTLSRNLIHVDDQINKYFNVDTYVVGKFTTGSIRHQLVTGFNLTREDTNYFTTVRRAAPIDLFNPIYGQSLGPVIGRYSAPSLTDTLGIYIQDQVTLADNLKLLLGGRFDTFSSSTEDRIANTKQEFSGDAFTPRVGIVYQPIAPISLYASYSRSFSPVGGTTFEGTPFQPERGTQYEVGVKADLNNRLSATLAFYDLTRSNVQTDDPVNPGFSIQTGEQRSKGVEFSIGGEILPGWNVIAGYAYTDATITKDNNLPVGTILNNIPKHSFNVWTTYEIRSGSLQGLGVGVGLFYKGDRQGDLANTFELPSYLTTDAAIFFKRERFRAALNFKNLFNVDYFESAISRLGVYPGEPFTVQGTISWEL